MAPVLAFGTWACLWNATTYRRTNGTVHRMMRCLLGVTCVESEDRLH